MATPISFPEVNRGLTKPEGMTDAQCQTLPVFTDGRNCISCWQPTPEELAELDNGGKIWLGVVSGSTQPPVFVQVACPIVYAEGPLPEPLPVITEEYDRALQQIAEQLPGNYSMHLGLLRTAYESMGQPGVVAYLKPYADFLHTLETRPTDASA